MPAPPEYQPLPHDGGDDVEHYPPQQPRPAMYYGEGEFDPPSSDDEEDSAFIEKGKGGEGERDGAALEEDGELVVGGKVRCRNATKRRAQGTESMGVRCRTTEGPRRCDAWCSACSRW